MAGEVSPPPVEESDIERVPIDGLVRGERAAASVSRTRSLQSRASSVFAGGLTILLGVGALTWYYANALTRPSRARDAAQAVTLRRAQGEMPLPSLGRIDPPAVAMASATAAAVPPLDGAPSSATSGIPALPEPIHTSPTVSAAARGRTAAPAAPDRRLSGPVFVREDAAASSGLSGGLSAPPSDEGALAQLLRPTPSAAVQAKILPTRRFLLPKGSFIDCTLETAIDSTLPGMTTCVAATDTFSADGSVVLLERGTRLVGETRGEVQQGTARVFVLWIEARTPTGVVVPLDSPGTDQLGRSGLDGSVDRHFWDRFGAAILITAIEGAVQAAAQPSGSGGTVIYNPSASQEVLTEVLKGTLNIRPTVRKNQGDRIQVLVARDVDFRSVYELRR
jgi:type IV secretion system protein VirB10